MPFKFYLIKKCTIKPFTISAKDLDGITHTIPSLIKIRLDIQQYTAFKVEEKVNRGNTRLWGKYDLFSHRFQYFVVA